MVYRALAFEEMQSSVLHDQGYMDRCTDPIIQVQGYRLDQQIRIRYYGPWCSRTGDYHEPKMFNAAGFHGLMGTARSKVLLGLASHIEGYKCWRKAARRLEP